MGVGLLFQMIGFSIFGSFLYTLLGVIPGTDETAVLAPVTLALALTGLAPEVIVAFFIASIVAKMITGNIPVGIVGIPSGVMSAPMIPAAMHLKKSGKSDIAIRKMSAGSVIGTVLAIPLSFMLASFLVPFSEAISDNATVIFMFGTLFLALMSKNKIMSIVAILPLSILIQGLNHLYWGLGVLPEGQSVFISFFLAITIGPLMINLLELLSGGTITEKYKRDNYLNTMINKSFEKQTLNPLKILSKKEAVNSVIATFFGVITFFMSPVGMMIFIGETIAQREKDEEDKAKMTVTVMNALNNGAYIAGVLIPLLAIGIPLSGVAIGPGNALFNAPPVYTLENNIHHQLSQLEFIAPVLIGASIAIGITYFLTVKYANEITLFIFSKIPHEAILGLFIALVVMLAYMDVGIINIFGVLVIATTSGIFNRWGVNYGVQFMILYASSGFIDLLL